jgi:hypothetical protein
MQERGSRFETPFGRSQIPRKRAGLETPLSGRFYGENKRLVFAPPLWYDLLVAVCIFGGLGFAAYALMNGGLQIGNAPLLGFFLGVMVTVAGVWAAFSNERMACDLRRRTYARLEGQGLGKRLTRGSLDELDAVVLLTEEWAVPLGGSRPVIYRLVLHWRGAMQPLVVVGVERHMLRQNEPLNSRAGLMLNKGSRYAHALGVTFYDNSYYPSPCPVRVTG